MTSLKSRLLVSFVFPWLWIEVPAAGKSTDAQQDRASLNQAATGTGPVALLVL